MKLPAIGVENADLLHALDRGAGGPTEIGHALGRDKSNVAKTVGRLREEGLVQDDGYALTDAGRAITRLIGPRGEVLAPGDMVALRRDQIDFDPENERDEEDMDLEALLMLSESIVIRGLQQNLVVTAPAAEGERFTLVIGERRLRAIDMAIIAGRWAMETPIACKLAETLSPIERAFARLTENLQREDLHPLSEGAGYLKLRNKGVTDEQIAEGVKRSKKHVQDRMNMVLKLDDGAKRRMRLPPEDDRYLGVKAARTLMQDHKPKPAVEVTAKEALVLLEVLHRSKAHPSTHPQFFAAGWTGIAALPAGGAASSLIDKRFMEIAEPSYGPGAFVRVAPHTDLAQWLANRCVAGLEPAMWSAQAEVLTPLAAEPLRTSGRYATDWLNAPAEPTNQPLIPAEAGTQSLAPSAEPTGDIIKGDAAEVIHALHPENPVPILTQAEAAAMAEVCHAIEHHPLAGPQNAYEGARIFDSFRADAVASALVVGHRLIKVQPDSHRKGYLVCLASQGEAWRDANRDAIDAVEDYATPWLTEPPPTPQLIPAAQAAEALARTDSGAPRTFSEQLRDVIADDEQSEERKALVSDLTLAGQLRWLDYIAPEDPTAIALVEDDELPIAHAVARSLRILNSALAYPNQGFRDLIEAIRDTTP